MAAESVLITGASAGIGWELARLFAADRSDLVLVARRRDKLEQLAAQLRAEFRANVRVVEADLARPSAPAEIFDSLAADGVAVDVLVNNAGFGALGQIAELPLQQQVDMVRVNVVALTDLTRRFLPEMLRRGRGGVLNVGSTAGFQPGPGLAVYYATKAYVLSFTEALAEEVRGSGLHVTCLAPGPTATEFAAVARMEHAPLFRLRRPMTSRAVAEAGYRAFRRGRVLVIPGLLNRIGATSVRFAPRWLVPKITKRLQGME